MNYASLGKEAKIGIGNALRQFAQKRLAVLAKVRIAEHDEIRIQVLGQNAMTHGVIDQPAGQIQLANFPNPGGLNSLGGNLYTPTDASGDATVGPPGGQEGLGTVMQGYVEQSNVSIVQEFVNMIVAQRGYEANSKVVQAADQMYQQINNLSK